MQLKEFDHYSSLQSGAPISLKILPLKLKDPAYLEWNKIGARGIVQWRKGQGLTLQMVSSAPSSQHTLFFQTVVSESNILHILYVLLSNEDELLALFSSSFLY